MQGEDDLEPLGMLHDGATAPPSWPQWSSRGGGEWAGPWLCCSRLRDPLAWAARASRGTGAAALRRAQSCGFGRGGPYQRVLLLELGDLEFALLLVLLDRLLDALSKRVQLDLPLFLLFQAVLENVHADGDKFVLVGGWALRKLRAASLSLGAGHRGGPQGCKGLLR